MSLYRKAPPSAPPAPAALSADPAAPDAAYAPALSLPPEALAAPESPASAEEALAGEKVLAHFALHRPGPASFPTISLRILELVRYPDVNLAELAKYIRMDGALAAGCWPSPTPRSTGRSATSTRSRTRWPASASARWPS